MHSAGSTQGIGQLTYGFHTLLGNSYPDDWAEESSQAVCSIDLIKFNSQINVQIHTGISLFQALRKSHHTIPQDMPIQGRIYKSFILILQVVAVTDFFKNLTA
jgi:hypothetical protein